MLAEGSLHQEQVWDLSINTIDVPDTVLNALNSDDTYPSETKIFRVQMVPSFFHLVERWFSVHRIHDAFFKKHGVMWTREFCQAYNSAEKMHAWPQLRLDVPVLLFDILVKDSYFNAIVLIKSELIWFHLFSERWSARVLEKKMES